mmetsp:Transcript_17914/g.46801  ORF Transcript_17914/g.46801 Transcript_17914/m.46801 type:complete len:282 (-) Transcript_17914:595-1440(-)
MIETVCSSNSASATRRHPFPAGGVFIKAGKRLRRPPHSTNVAHADSDSSPWLRAWSSTLRAPCIDIRRSRSKITINSTPSASRKTLIFDLSITAEHRAPKRFCNISNSSPDEGSFRLYWATDCKSRSIPLSPSATRALRLASVLCSRMARISDAYSLMGSKRFAFTREISHGSMSHSLTNRSASSGLRSSMFSNIPRAACRPSLPPSGPSLSREKASISVGRRSVSSRPSMSAAACSSSPSSVSASVISWSSSIVAATISSFSWFSKLITVLSPPSRITSP